MTETEPVTQQPNSFPPPPPSQKFIDEQQAKYFDFSDIILTETEPITQQPNSFPPPSKELISSLKNQFSNLSNISLNKNKTTFRKKVSDKNKTTFRKKVSDKNKNNNASQENSSSSDTQTSYTIAELQTAYKYNNVQNQSFSVKPVIAIVMYNSYADLQSNFDLFCQANNLPAYTLNIIPINNPPEDSNAGSEMCIDTQCSYGICPNADLVVVQAESSSVQDLSVAISVANSYNPDIINMSWGVAGTEFTNEQQENTENLFTNDCLYCASSGDSNNVGWPSTDPGVLAVGGTSLYTNSDGSILSQSAWSSTGCGPSAYFDIPNYQKNYTNLTSTFRNTCDLSALADVDTGVQCYWGGEVVIFGGTSVAAPLCSGLFAIVNGIRKNQNLGIINSSASSNLGVQNILYSNYASNGSSLFYDVVEGSSGSFAAGPGWDNPSGLGTPYGEAMVNFLANFLA